MSGHTPGPWSARTEWEDSAVVLDARGYSVAMLSLIAINRVWQDEHPGEHWGSGGEAAHINRSEAEVHVNARLIAAAPDLLEALHGILGPLATIPMGEGGPPSEQVPEKPNLRVSGAAIRRARAAIAKAEGRADERDHSATRRKWDPEPDPDKRDATDQFAERDE